MCGQMCGQSNYPHPLTPYGTVCAEVAELQGVFEKWRSGRDGMRILEAGCGSASYLWWPPQSHITGLDISQKQLDRNETVHEKILGDVQTHLLAASSYDVIICWDVLEHVPRPDRAIRNFVQAIRPGGIVILAFPNVASVKGLIAKFTPHWFHVWVYRKLWGISDAGKEDTPPFRTFLRFSISPRAIRKAARRYGLKMLHERLYQTGMQRELRSRHRVVSLAISVLRWAIKVFTLGRIDGALSDCIFVLHRPAPPAASETTSDSVGK